MSSNVKMDSLFSQLVACFPLSFTASPEPGDPIPRLTETMVKSGEVRIEFQDCFADNFKRQGYISTNVVIYGPGEKDLLRARVKAAEGWDPRNAIGQFSVKRIPYESVYPEFPTDGRFTQAPNPLPPNTWVKKPNFFTYTDRTKPEYYAEHLYREADMCELLLKNPHPHFAEYRGCVVENGRIVGIAFKRYVETIRSRVTLEKTIAYRKQLASGALGPLPSVSEDDYWYRNPHRLADLQYGDDTTPSAEEKAIESRFLPPFDRVMCYKNIRSALHHMHSLNLIHNKVEPENIMLDENDKAILIDFDCTRYVGEWRGKKEYAPGWSLESARVSEPKNDNFSMTQVRDYLGGFYHAYYE